MLLEFGVEAPFSGVVLGSTDSIASGFCLKLMFHLTLHGTSRSLTATRARQDKHLQKFVRIPFGHIPLNAESSDRLSTSQWNLYCRIL